MDPQTPDAAPAPAAPAAAPVADAPAASAPRFDGEFDAERAAKLVENLRTEVASLKEAKRTAEATNGDLLARITQALGITPEGKPDPERLAQELTESQQRARSTQVEFAVWRAAQKAGADADALLDSRAFADSLAALDPADKTFTANVERAVTAAIEANPRYKATGGPSVAAPPDPAPDRSGGEFAGGTGQARQITEAELNRMTPEQIVEARANGLLSGLLGS